MLGIGRIAREHPLAHGVCSQLLRILYLAELNGIDGHAVTVTEAEERGIVREKVKYDDDVIRGTCVFKVIFNSFYCMLKLPLERGGQGREGLLVGLYQ